MEMLKKKFKDAKRAIFLFLALFVPVQYLVRFHRDFSKANLKNVRLEGSDLTNIDFREADLRGAWLMGADLRYANLTKANLTEACISKANLKDANLTEVDLRDARLKLAYLIGANLTNAKLNYARLTDANLTGANLRGAQLQKACLAGADLEDVDLTGAKLARVDLTGAKLARADLEGTNLDGIRGLPTQQELLEEHFTITDAYIIEEHFTTTDAYITVYKIIGQTEHPPPKHWVIEEGSFLEENGLDRDFRKDCGPGVNFGTQQWIRASSYTGTVWECRIHKEDWNDVVIPYSTNGKGRCRRLQLVKEVEEIRPQRS